MKINLFFIYSIFFSVLAYSQTNYQRKLFQTSSTDNVSEVVYANEYNTSTFIIQNIFGPTQYTGYGVITKFTTTSGNVTSSKTFSVTNFDITINGVCKRNEMLYMTAVATNSVTENGIIIKYNLSSNSITWRKKLSIGSSSFMIKSITSDTKNYLYVLGSCYNASNGNNDLFVSKLDTNGLLIWTKAFGEPTWDEEPSSIIYNGPRELYVSSVGFVGVIGRTTTIRLDTSGIILNTTALTTASSPRFGTNYSTIVSGKLFSVDKTTVGPSDPGPLFIRTLDSNLNYLNGTISSGIGVKNIFGNGSNLLITGAAPVSNGYPGFRTLRYDAGLNLVGSQYFDQITTSSIATSATCFINSSNQSFHFFKPNGIDTVFVVKADKFEKVGCNDNVFTLDPSIFNYTVTPYSYVLVPITSNITTFALPLSNSSFTTTSVCNNITTNVLSINRTNVISVYPNPAHAHIEIHSTESNLAKLSISDIFGREIINDVFTDSLDVSLLQNGIYFITLLNPENQVIGTHKFIKE